MTVRHADAWEELERSLSEDEIDRSPLHISKPSTGEYYCGIGGFGRGFTLEERNGCHPDYVPGTRFCANCGRPWCKECKRIHDLIHA